MNLCDELLRPVSPMYDFHQPGKKRRYPPDEGNKRYCSLCGWKPLSEFRPDSQGYMGRRCTPCYRMEQAASKRAKNGG